MRSEMISSMSSCGSLAIGDGRRVGVTGVPPKSKRSILATPRHQTLAASNSAAVAIASYGE